LRKSLGRSRRGLPFRVTQTLSGNPGVPILWHHHHLLTDALNALLRVPLFLEKSGVKNFGCRKMAKNYCVILSPANSPLDAFISSKFGLEHRRRSCCKQKDE